MKERLQAALTRWRSLEISPAQRRLRLALQLLFIFAAVIAFLMVVNLDSSGVFDRYYHFAMLVLIGAAAQLTVVLHVFRSDTVPLYVRDALDMWVALSSFWLTFTVVLLTVMAAD